VDVPALVTFFSPSPRPKWFDLLEVPKSKIDFRLGSFRFSPPASSLTSSPLRYRRHSYITPLPMRRMFFSKKACPATNNLSFPLQTITHLLLSSIFFFFLQAFWMQCPPLLLSSGFAFDTLRANRFLFLSFLLFFPICFARGSDTPQFVALVVRQSPLLHNLNFFPNDLPLSFYHFVKFLFFPPFNTIFTTSPRSPLVFSFSETPPLSWTRGFSLFQTGFPLFSGQRYPVNSLSPGCMAIYHFHHVAIIPPFLMRTYAVSSKTPMMGIPFVPLAEIRCFPLSPSSLSS